MLLLRVLAILLIGQAAGAQDWQTPARGSALRSDLMDALRPLVEAELGPPVEFLVHDLRVAGDAAFANVNPQRPGGGAISHPSGEAGFDGVATQALYRLEGGQWGVVHLVIGASDVWWADPAFCPNFAAVIPETCP